MANLNDRLPDNVPGAWYVDSSCIICGLCEARAPSVFRASNDGTHDYVYHQPATEEELRSALDAKENCPTDSIGTDGGAPR